MGSKRAGWRETSDLHASTDLLSAIDNLMALIDLFLKTGGFLDFTRGPKPNNISLSRLRPLQGFVGVDGFACGGAVA
jgi:hypothetical protein